VSIQNTPKGGTDARQMPSKTPDELRAGAVEGQDVIFLGWQKTTSGDLIRSTTYSRRGILSISPLSPTTTLHANHLRIPLTPSPYPGVGPSPWQDLGTELLYPATSERSDRICRVELHRRQEAVEGGRGPEPARHHTRSVGNRANGYRSSSGDRDDRYEPVQNRDAFRFFDNLVGTDEAIYETAGSLGRGERVWILAKLPGYIKVNRKDIVGKYLLLSNSHDGAP